MHIEKVRFTQEFKHRNISTWIGADMFLVEGDDAMEAKRQLQRFVHEAYYSTSEELPPDETPIPDIHVQKPKEGQSLEEQIRGCTTLDGLEEFKLIAKMNPKLAEAYAQTLINIHHATANLEVPFAGN